MIIDSSEYLRGRVGVAWLSVREGLWQWHLKSLEECQLVDIQDGYLIFAVPDVETMDLLSRKDHRQRVESLFEAALNHPWKLRFVVAPMGAGMMQ